MSKTRVRRLSASYRIYVLLVVSRPAPGEIVPGIARGSDGPGCDKTETSAD